MKKQLTEVKIGQAHSDLARVLSIMGFALAFLAIFLTNSASYTAIDDPIQNKFAIENWGMVSLIGFGILGFIVHGLQNSIYWPFWNRKLKSSADERTMQVRNRVFEMSYRLLFLILVAAAWVSNRSDDRMRLVLFWTAVSMFYALPAFVASFQKDS